MSSLSKRFSTIIRQSPPQNNSSPKDSATTEKPAKPATATNGTTAKEPTKQTDSKSATQNGTNGTTKPAETKPVKDTPSSTQKKEPKKERESTIKRFSSMLRPRGQSRSSKAKADAAAAAAAASKIPKKGAAKGKRVIVVTGASKGIGLEFVKHFATQPETFVIALSRSADKASSLRSLVSASAKDGHNVRAIKLDVTSTRSVSSGVKDIVELTDGHIDLIINAAGSRGEAGLKVWDIKGPELEEELRNNLVGPIVFTNSLLPYLKKKEEKEEKKDEKKEEEKEEKEEKKEEENREEKVEATKEDAKDAAEDKAKDPTTEDKAAPATTSEEPAGTSEEPAPAPIPEPERLPSQPFIVFLAPADPIHNAGGYVNVGSRFLAEPRTLFSISRGALQIAIGKYAIGLAGQGIGVVAIERRGHQDPNSGVSDEAAAAAIAKVLPTLTLRDNGKLLEATT